LSGTRGHLTYAVGVNGRSSYTYLMPVESCPPRASVASGDTTDTPDGRFPIPPRYWWLKRILLGVAGLLLFLLALRLWWGHVIDQRYQSELDRYRAAGEPIRPEDFDPPPVADEDNAALLYLEAINTIVPPNVDFDLFGKGYTQEYVHDHLDGARDCVETNDRSLDLARRARLLGNVDWGTRLQSPLYPTWSPNASQQRRLGKLISVAVLFHDWAGNHERAVPYLLDLLALGNAVDREPFLINHVVAISLRNLVTTLVEAVLPNIKACGDSDGSSEVAHCVPQDEIDRLLAMLLDETDSTAAARKAVHAERAMFLDFFEMIATGKCGPRGFLSMVNSGGVPPQASLFERAVAFPFVPLVQADTVWACSYYNRWADASIQETWSDALSLAPPDRDDNVGITDSLRHPAAFMIPSLTRAVQLDFYARADRRMAVVAIALRLYRSDYGVLPDELESLVRGYLDELPPDPFATGHQTFRYLPGNTRPILYSLGDNTIDDGGTVALGRGSLLRFEVPDRPFFLDGARPTKPEDLPIEMRPSAQGQNKQ